MPSTFVNTFIILDNHSDFLTLFTDLHDIYDGLFLEITEAIPPIHYITCCSFFVFFLCCVLINQFSTSTGKFCSATLI